MIKYYFNELKYKVKKFWADRTVTEKIALGGLLAFVVLSVVSY